MGPVTGTPSISTSTQRTQSGSTWLEAVRIILETGGFCDFDGVVDLLGASVLFSGSPLLDVLGCHKYSISKALLF